MRKWAIHWLIIIAVSSTAIGGETHATPPAQPADGPGGSKYAHASVTKHRHGTGGEEYWLYEPAEPRPHIAPVIVFLHGWGGVNPAIYGAWIDHLVRRGNIVIYPRYQADLFTPFADFTPNALTAIKNALLRLKDVSGRVRPDLEKFAVVGHSVGGLLTANVAALAQESKLPVVRAMMSVEPAPTWNPTRRMNVPLADLAKIPRNTLLLAVAGDSDILARDVDAKRVYYESTQIPAANKDFVILVSDTHGKPILSASHSAPSAPDKRYDNGEPMQWPTTARGGRNGQRTGEGNEAPGGTDRQVGTVRVVNALDYFGLWKLFDALCDAAFYQRNREFALGNTPQQRFMGKWSDGTAVKELIVTDKP